MIHHKVILKSDGEDSNTVICELWEWDDLYTLMKFKLWYISEFSYGSRMRLSEVHSESVEHIRPVRISLWDGVAMTVPAKYVGGSGCHTDDRVSG